MAIHKFLRFLFLSIVHARNYCPSSYCDNNAFSIQYPLGLQHQQPQTCGLPGFNLSCDSQKKATLNIPNSREFYNYTYFGCPKAQFVSSSVIDCLSGTTNDIFAAKYKTDIIRFSTCKKISTLQIPVSSSYDFGFPGSLMLTWDVPTCVDRSSATGTSNKRPVFRIIALSFIIPAIVTPALIVSISCCICMTRGNDPQTTNSTQTSSGTDSSVALTRGLHKSTIETYRKIPVGASHRIEGPNDVTCTICLGDYVPEDTIRFMPECEHCFHVECIDKWPSMNSKCPICRTSQNYKK